MAKKKVEEASVVFCRDCRKSTEFIANSCYCKGLKKQVCAANRYGRPIQLCNGNYETKKIKK